MNKTQKFVKQRIVIVVDANPILSALLGGYARKIFLTDILSLLQQDSPWQKQKNNLAKLLRRVKGQRIKDFTIQEGVDQRFHLVTDKLDLRFGANDLGCWVEEAKTR